VFGLIFWFAACTNLNDLTAPECTYSVAPTSATVSDQGGSGTLAVKAPGVCAWTVESPASWLTVTPRSGNGDATVTYTATAQEGVEGRASTFSVAGQSVTVSQTGRPLPACTYSVSPPSAVFAAAGGANAVVIQTLSHCTWTAASQTGWITLTSAGSGSGSGAFSYVVAVNTGTATRNGTLTAAGNTIAITQGGTAPPPNCTYTISPNSATFQRPGGTGTINVTAPAGCVWTAVSQQNWILIRSGATGSGNGQVQYSVDPCTCNSDRNGRIVVAGRNFDIRQEDKGDAPALSGVLPSGR
jgi:hypothetical protein